MQKTSVEYRWNLSYKAHDKYIIYKYRIVSIRSARR